MRIRLLSLLLAALLALTCAPASAEEEYIDDLIIENVLPDEPVVTETEFLRVTAEYLPDEDITRHTAELLGSPTFDDGTPLTANDILFSLYYYLDPACSLFTYYEIPGLESYQRQISEARLTGAAEAMASIEAAGPEYIPSEADGWTQALQDAFWNLQAEYSAACAAEFPKCAQAIADYCAPMLADESRTLFGRDASEDLLIAYAMLQWGYAEADDNILTAKRSGKMWNLNDSAPTAEDFAAELSLAYDGDLAACWAVETSGNYWPELPSVNEAFLQLYVGGAKDSVTSISGIRMTDDRTVEVDLIGVNMHGSPFGLPILSLAAAGDMEKWKPESGLYGHDFGDVAAIEASGFNGNRLLDIPSEIIF